MIHRPVYKAILTLVRSVLGFSTAPSKQLQGTAPMTECTFEVPEELKAAVKEAAEENAAEEARGIARAAARGRRRRVQGSLRRDL
jgi:hypothetical protein